MRRLRVLLLTLRELVPPESIEGLSDREILPYKADFDVRAAIEDLGHETRFVGVEQDLSDLDDAISYFKPHIVFNLLEDFAGREDFLPYVIGYLELIKQAYTGCNPVGMLFASDKALQRKVLRHHRIPVPDFAIARREHVFKRPPRLDFPLIVKSLTEHASRGIAQASVVHDDTQLAQRIEFVHEQVGTDAIVEQYIHGRELYVGIIGNHRLETFPIWELHFEKLREGVPQIATEKVKFDLKYQKRVGVITRPASDLSQDEESRLLRLCKRAYRVLDQSGYARMDLRVDEKGKAFLIESNPNPQLSFGEDFAESAEAGGLAYDRLIQRILNLGLRWRHGR